MFDVYVEIPVNFVLYLFFEEWRSKDKIFNIIKHLDFVSIDEKQGQEINYAFWTGDVLAIVRVFDVSCWWWLQTLNIWVITI